MDEFGVLTERFGLKPQGKSAPMASSKRPTGVGGSQPGINSFNHPKSSSQNGSRSHQHSDSDFDGIFSPSNNKKTQNFGGLGDGIDDIFGPGAKSNTSKGSSFDYDSIFGGSNRPVSKPASNNDYVDDIFGVMPEKKGVGVDDLLDKIGGLNSSTSNKSSSNVKKAPDFDELIPGFGGSSSSKNGRASNKSPKPTATTNKPAAASHDDPFLVFETTSRAASSESFFDSLEQINKWNNSKGTRDSSGASPILRPPPKATNVSYSNKVNSSNVSSIDELEEFAMGKMQNNATRKANINTGDTKRNLAAKINKNKGGPAARVNQSNGVDDLESFFGTGSRSSSVPKSRASNMDNTFDHQLNDKGRSGVSQGVSHGVPPVSSASAKKPSAATSFDDLSLIFGGSPTSEFQEIEGESEERRKARLQRHQRTQERSLKALADMNQRDHQTKMEQEERHRIADYTDVQIKRWAAGKEANMRALLSSLQDVLWPECGWEPVSITDMISSTSVKKVYRKATLCIHPDKVQQKGATLEQKYIAEKVFDILKAAWTKFNAEELS
ncbi:auxilin-related protein 2 [Arachis stenosperma]|uniref:auxilin-related protein 2 n=1 Tax=Arachis stenosperma TaxID=217475 RepID=UPI0025ABAD53|nr:auxilin-related protein 2 [Arachis stenosperma]